MFNTDLPVAFDGYKALLLVGAREHDLPEGPVRVTATSWPKPGAAKRSPELPPFPRGKKSAPPR